jgi:hypothetical protein
MAENQHKATSDKNPHKTNKLLSFAAIALAIIAILLGGWGFTASNNAEKIAKWCAAHQLQGPIGTPGASAYTVWLSVGNTGSLQDFLDSLIGEKGSNGYRGSTGFNGADGKDGATGPSGTAGASAYQLWLDAGNTGTPEEFLTSLIGASGSDGTDGTNGINGTNGTAGASGLSAYELWVAQGNSGTETDFLNSLVGKDGSNGSNGSNGTNGKSAYQIWLDAGNTGTEIDFLASLKGADGVCTPGSGLGYFGSFYDTTTQVNDQAINAMTYNQSDAGNQGVKIVDGSKIVIEHPGTYNIQFSAQVTRLSGGHSADIEIWLKQNGVNYPNSTTAITLQANAKKQVAAWNFFVTTTNINEYFELAWASDEPTMELLYRQSNSTPAIPSVILTVSQVN